VVCGAGVVVAAARVAGLSVAGLTVDEIPEMDI
jgi:hypothetical protein